MALQNEIETFLIERGISQYHFVDVSHLPEKQTKGLCTAILFLTPLSAEFIKEVAETENYVQNLIRNNLLDEDEFSRKEAEVGQIADMLAAFLQSKGYRSYSQSDKNLEETGCYNFDTHTTPLPHKTIATLAGLGWIGRNNLLITEEFGSAVSICSVLTNAALPTKKRALIPPKCGNCFLCVEICPTGALTGKLWNKNTSRDEIVNVHACTTCLKCLANCPWTQSYVV